MKKILVAYSANNVAAREFIIGVFNFINEGHDWNIRMLGNPYEITPETISYAIKDGTDGILTGFNMVTPGYKALLKSGIPLVLNNFPPQLPPPELPHISVLHNDEIAIGRKAAALFQMKPSLGGQPTASEAFAWNYRVTDTTAPRSEMRNRGSEYG